MPKLDLTRALRIKTSAGELRALRGAGFAWTRPSGGGEVTVDQLGYDTPAIGDTSLPGNTGRVFMSRHVMPRAGTLRRIWLYSTSAAGGLVKGVVYADNAGEPGARIAAGGGVGVVQNGWAASECGGESLPGAAIWFGGITEDWNSSLYAASSGGTGWAQWGDGNYANPSSPPGGGAASYRVMAYLEYEY